MGIKAMGGPVRGVTQMLPLQNGLSIPSLGFGTYRMAPTDVEGAVSVAVEHGFRHVDCAKIYMNQSEVGFALEKIFKSHSFGVRREDMFITSKLWPTDQRPDVVEKACRDTLAELRLDYLDLYLIHWPVAWKHTGDYSSEEGRRPRNPTTGLAAVDHSVTLADTWKAMMRLVDLGLVRSLGVSNCDVSHLKQLTTVVEDMKHAPVTNQVEFHPGCHQSDLWSDNCEFGLVTSAYCPLGMPTRFTPPDFQGVAKDEVLQPLGVSTGYSVPRVLLNWNLDCGNVVIVKSSNRNNIIENSKACRFALGDSVRWMLSHYEDQMERSYRVINPTDFLDEPRPFFPPRNVKRKVHRP